MNLDLESDSLCFTPSSTTYYLCDLGQGHLSFLYLSYFINKIEMLIAPHRGFDKNSSSNRYKEL